MLYCRGGRFQTFTAAVGTRTLLFFIRLACKAIETRISSTSFDQSRLNRFYQPWAREPGRLGSEFGSVCSRPGSGRGSAHCRSGLGSVRLGSDFVLVCSRVSSKQFGARLITGRGSARFGSLFGARLISTYGSARDPGISSMFGSAQLGARLGLGTGLGLEIQLGSGLSSAHLARLGTWDRGSASKKLIPEPNLFLIERKRWSVYCSAFHEPIHCVNHMTILKQLFLVTVLRWGAS